MSEAGTTVEARDGPRRGDAVTVPSEAFEETRLSYCERLFERENQRKEALEKKAQFLLSIATLALGAVFLKLDVLKTVASLLPRDTSTSLAAWMIRSSLVLLGGSLLAAVLCIIAAMWLQGYKNEYPKHVVTDLFSPGSRYFQQGNDMSFRRATAMSYALALEGNAKTNDRKASWVKAASVALVCAVGSLAALVGTIAALYLAGG